MLKTLGFWGIFFASLTFFSPVQAQTLTESQIKTFLQNENKILKENAGRKSPNVVKEYLEKHLASNFTYADEVKSSLGHFGSSTENLSYNRRDYIESIIANISGIKGVKSSLSIKSVDISRDGQSARVKYKSVAKLDADGAQFQQSGNFGLNTSSNCEANLKWNIYSKAIQTERLACKTDASMQLPEGF